MNQPMYVRPFPKGREAPSLEKRINLLERAFRKYLEHDHSNAHAREEALKILNESGLNK